MRSPLASFVLVGVFLVSLGHGEPTRAERDPAQPDSGARNQSQPETLEIQLLRQEISLLQNHNSELRSVVIWSLTFAAAFLVGFLALVGFLTIKRYDQDKESLRAHLDGELRSASARRDEAIHALRTQLTSEIAEREAELSREISEQARNAVKAGLAEIESSVRTVSKEVASIRGDLLESEAKREEEHGIVPMAVTRYFNVAEHAWSQKDRYTLSKALEKIEQLLDKGGYFTAHEKVRVSQFFQSLPKEFAPLAAAITKHL